MAIKNTLILSASTTQIFLAAGDQAVTTMIFCNTDAGTDAVIDVYIVPSGNLLGAGNQIMKNLSLPAGETFVLDSEKFILESGDAIYAQADVNNIVCATISSVSL